MHHPERPWSVPVVVAEIPDGGSHRDLAADASERDAIAQFAGLRELPQLAASFDLERRGDAVAVRGEVRAQVGQTCVVTLEPIVNEVRESVDLVFAPTDADAEGVGRTKRKGEPPEPLANGTVDLGVLVTEFLILGLDPYPRKPGVAFERPRATEEGPHPFAALKALKNRL